MTRQAAIHRLLILLQEQPIQHRMLHLMLAITINMGVVIIMEIMGNITKAILIDFQDLSLFSSAHHQLQLHHLVSELTHLKSFMLNNAIF